MTTLALDLNYPKPLPSPGRDDKLPLPPPSDSTDSTPLPPPPPPPKKVQDESDNQSLFAMRPPQIATLPSFGALDPGLVVPLTPSTPTSPPSPSSAEGRPKKSNPLADLIDTEKAYVDQLTGIIRKIAAAWSRSNLPPPDLDMMFRSIEGVYKANRSLLLKLKEIGASPSSPKALGDLLMRWIDDLEDPYTTYCAKYCCGFDTWEPVQSNPRLASIICNFSTSNPPPTTAVASSTSEFPTWTLDALFLLPKARLKYYKKLYSRLLKSTTPGRSDHRLLIGALDKLDKLLDTLESRQDVKVGSTSATMSVPSVTETEDEVVIDLRSHGGNGTDQGRQNGDLRTSEVDTAPGSESSSARGSIFSSQERSSRETASTSISRGSSATLSMPISDLERRLATHRTLDIFTMKPKAVRLQIAPPSLPFTRELRFSVDVVASVTPRATGVEVVHRQGHVFLLSDLFLVCERMTPEERAKSGSEGADMWLCYPPLAGKVLRVSEVSGQETAIHVAIMRKETLILQTESVQVRNFMMAEFNECIGFAGSVSPLTRQPPPPMPPLNGLPRSPSASVPSVRSLPQVPGRNSGSTSPPIQRSSSPSMMHRPDVNGVAPLRLQENDQPLAYPNSDRQTASKLVLSPEAQVQQGAQRVPSLHDPLPGPMYPRTSSSAQAYSSPMSIGPGQVIPAVRSTGFVSPTHQDPTVRAGPSYGPNLPMGQHGHPSSFHQSIPNHSPNQPFPPRHQSPYGPPPGALPSRSPSEPSSFQGGIRKTPSTRSLASQYEQPASAPPLPTFPGGFPPNNNNLVPRNDSYGSLHAPQPRAVLPSVQLSSRSVSMVEPSFLEPSPPNSPVEERTPRGPVTSTISAQMKCKVFLQQQHAQWKSLGSAKLKLYQQDPTNIKQLVVEAENKEKSVLISTIVLTDGVERVGKTGVAIELSDKGTRTGIVYMIQLRNEKSAGGLFDSLLAGSDRAATQGRA